MKNILIVSVAALGLAACSTIFNGQTQPFMIVTPGAENTRCHIFNEDFKYRIDAGREYDIMRSPNPMTVDCRAPGNRRQTIMIEPKIQKETYGNVATLGVGAAYDHFSKGMYAYPEVISVDFTGQQSTLYPPPDYMTEDLEGASGAIESYAPSTPQIQADAHRPNGIITKRDWSNSITGSPFGGETLGAGEAGQGTIPATK